MNEKSASQSAFCNLRLLVCLAVVLVGAFLALRAFGAFSNAFDQTKGTKPAPSATQGQRPKVGFHATGENFWASTGGPQGGDVLALVTNASGNLFAGTLGGGVFRSADNGETWTAVNSGLTASDIRALATNAAEDVFAGTFSGVFRSTDNGDTWTAVNNGLEYPFIISLATNSSGDIFAGTFEGGGVFRSTDNGANWTLVIDGLTNTYVYALAINASGQIFAATWGGGVFRSIDNGENWVEVNTGITVPFILSLAINASGDIFAGADFGGGVFRSTNNGDSWTPVDNGLTTSNNVNALTIASSGDIFAGIYGDGVFRSTDNGDNWTQLNNGLTATFVLSFTVGASGDIFAGTYFGGGVFRSTDNGGTWSEQNDGLVATDVRTIAVTGNNDIFAGTYGIGMFRSTDSGESWEKVNNGLLGLYVRSLAINSNGDIFAGADFIGGAGGVFRSTDNGQSWTEVNQGVIKTDVRALAINPSGDVFAGTYFGGGIFRSTDNGQSWTPVDTGLTCTNIYSLAINLSGDIFAGTAGCGEGVFRSTDNGDHWTLVNNGLTSTDIAALTINENGDIFAGTYSQFGVGGGVFRSINNGDTWTAQNSGFTALDVNSLAHNSAGDLFAGAAGGAFRSTNNGDDWSDISSGLIPVGGNVWAVAIDATGYAFAGTAGGGVFRGAQPTPVPTPTPTPGTPTPTPTPTPSATASPTATATPGVTPTILWYNGDAFNGGSNNEINGADTDGHVFSDFDVTDPSGWNVTALFSRNLMSFTTTQAAYEIRSGVSNGNGGTLLFSGTASATQVPTGRSLLFLTEYTIQISDLNIFLPPGTYFLNVAPIGQGSGQSFNSNTEGANAVGSPPGNNGNEFYRSTNPNFPANYIPFANLGSGHDFSNGVIGTVAPPAAQAINFSTRMRVQTGDKVGIGGFIITGTAPKHVLLRAIGPSLTGSGVPGVLADPVLELYNDSGLIDFNNDWKDTDQAAIEATGIPPINDLESAIDATLAPGAYTAIVRGGGNTSGIGLVEVYDLNQSVASKLANISTRAFVSTGDGIVIAGVILGGGKGDDRVVVRGIGPSLTGVGVPNVLANPTLELRDGDGALLVANNDWQDDPTQAAELTAAGLAPTNQLESGIAATLPPGLYTVLLAGLNNGTGIGLVEVYDRGAQ